MGNLNGRIRQLEKKHLNDNEQSKMVIDWSWDPVPPGPGVIVIKWPNDEQPKRAS